MTAALASGATAAERRAGSSWRVVAGAGTVVAPVYPGDNAYQLEAVPVFDVTYRERFFLRSREGLGADLLRGPDHRAGLAVNYAPGRDPESGDLDGLGRVGDGVSVDAFLEWFSGPWTFDIRVAREFTGEQDGLTAQAGGGWRTRLLGGSAGAMIRVAATWADSRHMDAFFGISPAQSRRSGLPEFDANDGMRDVTATLAVDYPLSARWIVGGFAGAGRLLGDAADSPLVERRGSANQFFGGVTISYRLLP